MWSNEIATVLDAVLEGGAKVVNFDVIFPTSVERKHRGHDLNLLITLRKASRVRKRVLGKVKHQHKPISPFPGYSFVIGHQRNIRPLNLLEYNDGVIRRLPLFFRSADQDKGERREPSMALKITSRVVGANPTKEDDNESLFNGRSLTFSGPGPLINFDGGADWIPSYSLADLYVCALKAEKDYFRRHFSEKAILLSAVLDVEDRKLTSRRFTSTADGAQVANRCVNEPMCGLYRTDVVQGSLPGVYLHAAGINMLVRNEPVRELGKTRRVATAVILTWAITATIYFQYGFLIPLLHPLAAAYLSFGALESYRFTFADKDKRYLRQAISY